MNISKQVEATYKVFTTKGNFQYYAYTTEAALKLFNAAWLNYFSEEGKLEVPSVIRITRTEHQR